MIKKKYIESRDIVVNFQEDINKFSLSKEIASRERSIDFLSLLSYLPNPDIVLKKTGNQMKVYNELLYDSRVGGVISSRKSGVTSLLWEIQRKNSSAAHYKFIKKIFNNLDITTITEEGLDGSLFGYKPLEVNWKKENGSLIPENIIGKPPEWFVFGSNNQLLFKSRDNPMGEEIPPKKFLVTQHQANYANPYGIPVLSRCYWPVIFKKGGLQFWMFLAEKYGLPFVVGKHRRGATNLEIDKILEMLTNMITDAVAVIPEDADVNFEESSNKSASSDLFKKLIDQMNDEISIAIVGQTLTTSIGETGGAYAASKTHGEVKKDIVNSDKKMTEKMYNQLISWTIELNYGPTAEKPIFRLYAEEEINEKLAVRDKTLSETGVIFTKKYYEKNYGLEEDDFEIASPDPSNSPNPPGSPGSAEFSEKEVTSHPVNIPDFIPQKETNKITKELLKPVQELINGSKSYEDVIEQLAETFPSFDTKQLEDTLARLIFTGEVLGRGFSNA